MLKFARIFAIAALVMTVNFLATSQPASAADHIYNIGVIGLEEVTVSPVIAGDTINTMPAIPNGLFKKKWKGGSTYDIEEGAWKATVTHRKSGETYTMGGSHSDQESAQAEGDRVAGNLNNNVMDGPGCNPPLVLC